MNPKKQLTVGEKVWWFFLGTVVGFILIAAIAPQFYRYGGHHFLGIF
jgi:hypothetical protein